MPRVDLQRKETILRLFNVFQKCDDYKLLLKDNLSFEILSKKHSDFIVKWRNSPQNIELFTNQKEITHKVQQDFLDHYWTKNRIDLILKHDELPIGVFSLTNLFTESVQIGKLLGDTNFRGRGIAKKATIVLAKFAFDHLEIAKLSAMTKVQNSLNILLNEKIGFKISKEIIISGKSFYLMELKKENINCVD